MKAILKIILYIILIVLVAAAICSVVYAVKNGSLSGVSETINTALDNAAEWIDDKASYVTSLLGG
ncbi:MAG: hypothetical protein LUD27_00985 [Clostridia bacterium]|nr:hypothetical protein [Clostridia bacterium]